MNKHEAPGLENKTTTEHELIKTHDAYVRELLHRAGVDLDTTEMIDGQPVTAVHIAFRLARSTPPVLSAGHLIELRTIGLDV